jgi:hypothetical protein
MPTQLSLVCDIWLAISMYKRGYYIGKHKYIILLFIHKIVGDPHEWGRVDWGVRGVVRYEQRQSAIRSGGRV